MRDPLAENVALLLRFNGDHGGIVFPDDSLHGRTMTRNGSPITVTDQKVEGSASGYFDGANSYLRTEDDQLRQCGRRWTLESWIRCAAMNRNHGLWSLPDLSLVVSPAGALRLQHQNNYGTRITNTANGLIQAQTWHHIAVTAPTVLWGYRLWNGGSYQLFVDGIPRLTIDYVNPVLHTNGYINVGRGSLYGGNYNLHGHLDLFRYTLGVVRYAATFTPPITLPDCTPMHPTTAIVTSL